MPSVLRRRPPGGNISGPPAITPLGTRNPSIPPWASVFASRPVLSLSGFSPEVQVILRALKKYGMILADNGSSWYITGVPDERWDNDHLHELHQVPGSAFEAVNVSSLIMDPQSGQIRRNSPFSLPSLILNAVPEKFFPVGSRPLDYSPTDALT